MEELTKMVLESGLLQEREGHYELTGPLPPLAIPTTLHDSLMARLDRLATVKGLAQLGATLGREFSYELLQAVSPWDEGTLQHGLHQLVEAEFLYQRGAPPQATYLFKHALIQEAAYQSLLRSTRQQHHQRIAQVLEARFPDLCETQPELLAHHYTEAGLMAHAIPYWQRAGQRAVQRSANLEAIAHLTKGLELVSTLPATAEQTQQELALQSVLGPALMATKGYAAPEVEHAYARAWELCQRLQEPLQLFPVLRGLWAFHTMRAQLHTAYELGEQILRLARAQRDPAPLLLAHYTLGVTLFWLGEMVSARAHLEQAITHYEIQQHRSQAFLYGLDFGVGSLIYAARSLWHLGYPDQALARIREALALAADLSHLPSRAHTLNWAAVLYQYRREERAAQEQAGAAMRLSTEQGFALFLAWGSVLQGWALAMQGQVEEGVALMRQELAAQRATGAWLMRAHYLALLAEAHGKARQTEEGLTVLAEALDVAHRTGDRMWEAELYRLKGELLLGQVVLDAPRAETCFHQALAVARRQQAKALELRAATSLSRLWQQQGKRDAARQLLAPIYGWFTEGFDTADLQEAKRLLDALS
jgi:predicted ATPase